MPRVILACAARHLYCAAGDLAVSQVANPTERARLERVKTWLRPLLVRESSSLELMNASPRIVTTVGPSWTLLEALATVITSRRAHELENEIDPKIVELATHYLKGVQWAFPDDLD